MAIPSFSATNVLPPFVGSWPGAALGFAPYPTTLAEVVGSFGYSPERRRLLIGLIDLRAKLRALGVIIENQWLAGSFAEDIETSEGRNPGDIDVVSFVHRPAAASGVTDFLALINANLDVFHPTQAKATYHCDHYAVDLDVVVKRERICYWHSVFSHRRNGLWKGYVQVGDEGHAVDVAIRAQLIAQGVA